MRTFLFSMILLYGGSPENKELQHEALHFAEPYPRADEDENAAETEVQEQTERNLLGEDVRSCQIFPFYCNMKPGIRGTKMITFAF